MTDSLERYIEEHSDAEPAHLTAIRRRAWLRLTNPRMCSGHLQGRLLKMLAALTAPRRVLEIGTFVGYSAMCLAEGVPEGGVVDTFETNDELEDLIRENLGTHPSGAKVNLQIANVFEVLKDTADCYDLVFIDADKRLYADFYRLAVRVARPGALILVDNTLWDGHVAQAEYDRDAQTRGIRAFNDLAARDPRVERVILPVRDGLTLIRKL